MSDWEDLAEGAPTLNFDVMPAVELWINATYRRPNQSNRKPYATQKKKKGIIGSLSDRITAVIFSPAVSFILRCGDQIIRHFFKNYINLSEPRDS